MDKLEVWERLNSRLVAIIAFIFYFALLAAVAWWIVMVASIVIGANLVLAGATALMLGALVFFLAGRAMRDEAYRQANGGSFDDTEY